jgi:hypothetical protein
MSQAVTQPCLSFLSSWNSFRISMWLKYIVEVNQSIGWFKLLLAKD